MTRLAFYAALLAALLASQPRAHCDEMELRLPSGQWVLIDGTEPPTLTAIYWRACGKVEP